MVCLKHKWVALENDLTDNEIEFDWLLHDSIKYVKPDIICWKCGKINRRYSNCLRKAIKKYKKEIEVLERQYKKLKRYKL